jgi:hypothetical protein
MPVEPILLIRFTLLTPTDILHGNRPSERHKALCGLFNDALSNSEYIASNDRMINEL